MPLFIFWHTSSPFKICRNQKITLIIVLLIHNKYKYTWYPFFINIKNEYVKGISNRHFPGAPPKQLLILLFATFFYEEITIINFETFVILYLLFM